LATIVGVIEQVCFKELVNPGRIARNVIEQTKTEPDCTVTMSVIKFCNLGAISNPFDCLCVIEIDIDSR